MTNPYQNLSGNWASAVLAGASPCQANPNTMNSQIVTSLDQSYLPSLVPQPPAYDTLNFVSSQLGPDLLVIDGDYQNAVLYTSNFMNQAQTSLAMQLLSGVTEVSSDLIAPFIGAMEDCVTQSTLTDAQKAPLYMATMIGTKATAFWNLILNNIPIGVPWGQFFAPQPGPSPAPANLAKLPILVQAAMEGALVGYINFIKLNMPPTQDRFILTTLGASASINCGKIFYNWLPNHPIINGIDPSTAASLAYAYIKGQKSGNPPK